jgi:SOS-response transcriptional repressor LexA
MIGLTPRQRDLLEYLRAFIGQNGFAPKLDEAAAGLGLKSKSTAKRLMDGLVERGFVRRVPNLACAIELIPDQPIIINGHRYRFIDKSRAFSTGGATPAVSAAPFAGAAGSVARGG